MTSAPLRIDTGAQVGPYVLERRLSQGRASTLYLARTPGGGRAVLRVVHADVASASARARMKREGRALAGIDHPGLARVHGVGEQEGATWIATEHVHGVDLARILAERGSLPFDVALHYAIQIVEALAAVHEAGVVHRELKPSNVLVTPDGRAVLVDFGVTSRAADVRDGDEPTAVRETAERSSHYWAPEQIEHGLADERSDVWALGCLLYEMLVGAPPFGGEGTATAAAILRDEPVFPPHLPATVAHIISACLRKNSFARIATARELFVLLRDALDDPRVDTGPAAERGSPRPSVRPGLASGTIPPPPRVPSMPFAPSRISSIASARPPSSVTRRSVPRGRIKGMALRAGIAWFAETYGPPGLARVVELASPELKAMLRSTDSVLGLIASGWYDTQLVGELIELIERVASPVDRVAFGSSVGEATAHDNVRGVHRAVFRLVASPPLLEANAQRVWRTYVDEGTLSVRMRGQGSFDARVRGWTHHHPSVCRTLRAMLESSLRAVGYTALVLERRQCVGLGDSQCAFHGVWSA